MSVVNLLVSAGRRFSDWRHRQQAYAELMALDDHSLADIGLRPEVIAGTTRSSLQHQAHPAVVDEYFRSL